jgi:hypothetical protein
MSTLPDDPEVPDDVSTADYLEQQTVADPDVDPSTDPDAGDELPESAPSTGRVETEQLGTDVEADEADLLEQATTVPPEDDRLDQDE